VDDSDLGNREGIGDRLEPAAGERHQLGQLLSVQRDTADRVNRCVRHFLHRVGSRKLKGRAVLEPSEPDSSIGLQTTQLTPYLPRIASRKAA
jgi:hypothetical protein